MKTPRPYNKINKIHTWKLKALLAEHTVPEVADILGCSTIAVYKLIQRRAIDMHTMPSKK